MTRAEMDPSNQMQAARFCEGIPTCSHLLKGSANSGIAVHYPGADATCTEHQQACLSLSWLLPSPNCFFHPAMNYLHHRNSISMNLTVGSHFMWKHEHSHENDMDKSFSMCKNAPWANGLDSSIGYLCNKNQHEQTHKIVRRRG